jgi:uncharacterized protein YbgA (DUF1722 family)/uncharacterized protein YbbK (DUF523 family)
MSKPKIGISACLVGEPVRFNGGHKKHEWISSSLSQTADFQHFCPEVGIGQPTPRPAMRLLAKDGAIIATDSDSQTENFTTKLKDYYHEQHPDIAELDGFILMQGSPSCGMERVKLYGTGVMPEKSGTGIFAHELINNNPLMPVEEAGRLGDAGIAESFLSRLYVYHEWRTQKPYESAKTLINFHSKHKFLIMLHDYQGYRDTGKMLADLSDPNMLKEKADAYITRVMQALSKVSNQAQRANALLHLFGFIKNQLSAEEKDSILNAINAYQQKQIPYVVPMSLLRHYAKSLSVKDGYLKQQSVWAPYPETLTQYKNVL